MNAEDMDTIEAKVGMPLLGFYKADRTHGLIFSLSIALLIASVALAAEVKEPKELSQWIGLAVAQDYSVAASNGDARAQFLYGLSLLHGHIVVVQDRVPVISSIPLIGKRLFEKTHYFIDAQANTGQVATAYQWVNRARDQHFAPAIETEQLFRGRAVTPLPAKTAAPVSRTTGAAETPKGSGP